MLGREANARPTLPSVPEPPSGLAAMAGQTCAPPTSSARALAPGGCCSLTHVLQTAQPMALPSWMRSRTRDPCACTHLEAGRKKPQRVEQCKCVR